MGGLRPPSSGWGEFTSHEVSRTARYAHASAMWSTAKHHPYTQGGGDSL